MKRRKVKYSLFIISIIIFLFFNCTRYDQPLAPDSVSGRVKNTVPAGDGESYNTPAGNFVVYWYTKAGLGSNYNGVPIGVKVETLSKSYSQNRGFWGYSNNWDDSFSTTFTGNYFSETGLVRVTLYLDVNNNWYLDDGDLQVSGIALTPGSITLTLGP